jgi:hypothetical protein
MALLTALPAAAKEGVEATLTSDVPLRAEPGTPLTVRWTLSYAEDGKRRPFEAGGLYVRLRGVSRAHTETAWAGGDRGSYWAHVTVPKSGIGDIEFGLVGWQTDARGSRRADAIFPITNDPLPGSSSSAGSDGRGLRPAIWLLILVGTALATAAALGLFVRRRPQPRLS